MRIQLSIAAMMAGVLIAPAVRAQAPADPMAGFYGATLTIVVSPYFSAKRHYAPDHTYREVAEEAAQGDRTVVEAEGVWTIEDGKICVVRRLPEAGPRFCNLGLGRKPGDRWVDRDPYTGNEVRFALEPGRS